MFDNEHGDFQLSCRNLIIEVIGSGAWNEASINHLFAKVNALVDSFGGQPFATLIDVRFFSLGTPEFKKNTLEGTHLLVQRGLMSDAYVLGGSPVIKSMIEGMKPTGDLGDYQRAYFNSHLDALHWLQTRGFRLGHL